MLLPDATYAEIESLKLMHSVHSKELLRRQELLNEMESQKLKHETVKTKSDQEQPYNYIFSKIQTLFTEQWKLQEESDIRDNIILKKVLHLEQNLNFFYRKFETEMDSTLKDAMKNAMQS